MNQPLPEGDEKDPLARFRSWRGFLVAAIILNGLFVFTMLGHNDPSVALWHKMLIWLPFNAIATAVYLAILVRLSGEGGVVARTAEASGPANPRGTLYRILCMGLIVANWTVMFAV